MSDDADIRPCGILRVPRDLSASAMAELVERFERAQHDHRTQLLDGLTHGHVVEAIRVDDDLRGDTWGARHLPRRPRWLHCVYAWTLRYFWLPCPLCGLDFGGHETGGALYPDYSSGEGTSICLDCARAKQAP